MPVISDHRQAPPAIVIGLDCITGLQTARLLARSNVPILGIAKDRSHFGCRTRACERILYADTANDEFIQLLEQLGSEAKQKAVLFPCTDLSVLGISRNRDRLDPWYHIALPHADVVEMLMDKIRFYEFATRAGLCIPKTFVLRNQKDAERAADELTFPCILKPPVKTERWEYHIAAKAFKVSGRDHLLGLYDHCRDWADTLVAQQWIEGPEANLYSFNGYFDRNSTPRATFIARKLRQWPPQTGTSCLGEECRNDIVLREAIRLFQSVGYCGLAYVEMKRDDRTGKHFIIEPNIGRPTGRSAIAEAGGVPLLYTKYCDAVGWPLPDNREQDYEGVKWIFWRQDVRSAFYYWRKGELSLRQWWHSLRGRKASAVFSWTDPLPFCADFGRSIRRLVGIPKSQKTGTIGASQTEQPPLVFPDTTIV